MIRIMNEKDTAREEILSRVVPTVNVEAIVADIIAEVRRDGDAALCRLTEKFDKAKLDTLLVSPEEIAAARAASEGIVAAMTGCGEVRSLQSYHSSFGS